MRWLEDRRGRLPNLIIIGAMKSGTSSLHYYLNEHPEIQMSRNKELRFFIEEQNWNRGVEWYRTQFSGEAAVAGESTPAYTSYPHRRGIPARMHAVIPEAKLIYVVRDPLSRAVSHYSHAVLSGREQRSLGDALGDTTTSYVTRSKYFMQISQYLQHFSRSSILVVDTQDLLRHRAETLRTVFGFLGVDDQFVAPGFAKERGRTARKRKPTHVGFSLARTIDRLLPRLSQGTRSKVKRVALYPFSHPMEEPSMSAALREQLLTVLGDDARDFREWTGMPFPDWNV